MAFTKKPIQCTVNPHVHISQEVAEALLSVKPNDTVLVAGSGPAGLHAAVAFAKRGATVTLMEKESYIGGKWRQISNLRDHQELRDTLNGYMAQLETLGVRVELKQPITPALVEKQSPDILVLAIGARPKRADLAGLDTHPSVLHVEDILNANTNGESLDVKNLVIIGGNAAGVTAALHLAKQGYATEEAIGYLFRYGNERWAKEALAFRPNQSITVLKRRGFLGKGMGRATRWTAINEMALYGVKTLDRIEYKEICSDGIWIQNKRAKERQFLKADTIILATGFEPPQEHERYAEIVSRVLVTGDARCVGNITSAIQGLYE